MPLPNKAIRKALIKLLASATVLIALILGCFSDIDRGVIGIMGAVIILLAFPITVLLSIDASRVIKREMPFNKSMRILGAALGFPQAVLGTILVAFGITYPFIGIHDLVMNVSQGKPALVPFIRTITAIIMLGVGYYYIREGLGLDKNNGEREHD